MLVLFETIFTRRPISSDVTFRVGSSNVVRSRLQVVGTKLPNCHHFTASQWIGDCTDNGLTRRGAYFNV